MEQLARINIVEHVSFSAYSNIRFPALGTRENNARVMGSGGFFSHTE